MIELRWLVIADRRELQYRQWRVRIDASGAITPLPLPIEWSEWANVQSFIEHTAGESRLIE
jgi:hypothetical protein